MLNNSTMNTEPNDYSIQSEQAEQAIRELKKLIFISKQELISLVNTNQFSQKVSSYNVSAQNLIQDTKVEEALVYLAQAQKVLEYAASSGKNIQRSLIIEVLHHEACCYQVLWDLGKCSNYIEALIFNLNSQLRLTNCIGGSTCSSGTNSIQPSEIRERNESELGPKASRSSSIQMSMTSFKSELNKIEKKLELSKYYLLFCAISSQLKKNKGALVSAQRASELIKNTLQSMLQCYSESKHSADPNMEEKYRILRQTHQIADSVPVKQLSTVQTMARHHLKIYNSRCMFSNLNMDKNRPLKQAMQRFMNFSIGNIMQLNTMKVKRSLSLSLSESVGSQRLSEQVSFKNILEKVIVLSISQFTTATELRYIALNNCDGNKEQSKQTAEYAESQIYHLMAILTIAMYVPFKIVYMDHIISSFHNHYEFRLIDMSLDLPKQPTSHQLAHFEQIMFVEEKVTSESVSVISDSVKVVQQGQQISGQKKGSSTASASESSLESLEHNKKKKKIVLKDTSSIICFESDQSSEQIKNEDVADADAQKANPKNQKATKQSASMESANMSCVLHEHGHGQATEQQETQQKNMFNEYYYIKKEHYEQLNNSREGNSERDRLKLRQKNRKQAMLRNQQKQGQASGKTQKSCKKVTFSKNKNSVSSKNSLQPAMPAKKKGSIQYSEKNSRKVSISTAAQKKSKGKTSRVMSKDKSHKINVSLEDQQQDLFKPKPSCIMPSSQNQLSSRLMKSPFGKISSQKCLVSQMSQSSVMKSHIKISPQDKLSKEKSRKNSPFSKIASLQQNKQKKPLNSQYFHQKKNDVCKDTLNQQERKKKGQQSKSRQKTKKVSSFKNNTKKSHSKQNFRMQSPKVLKTKEAAQRNTLHVASDKNLEKLKIVSRSKSKLQSKKRD